MIDETTQQREAGREGEVEILRRALAWHGDPQRMATTREEWQQVIDDAIVWVKANPEPDRPSFSTLAAARLAVPTGEDKSVDDYAYDELWNAIADATRIDGGIIAISVVKFRNSLRSLPASPAAVAGEGS